MSVKVSPGKVNTDQFNMVAGSITLSTLLCSSFPSSFSHPHLSFCNLLQSFFFFLVVSGPHIACSVSASKPFHGLLLVNDNLYTVASSSLISIPVSFPCLSFSSPLPIPNHQPASPSPLSLSLSLPHPTPPHPSPSQAPALLLADN